MVRMREADTNGMGHTFWNCSLASRAPGQPREGRGCDRGALALAARERDAAVAERRLEFLRQPLDELGRKRELRGAFDFGVARVRSAEADVVGDRGGEYDGILRDQRNA